MICDEKRCYICGRRSPLHVHHCLHGYMRKRADKHGLTVYLCVYCHGKLHDKGIHDLELKQLAQRTFEEKYGHERYMSEFGKNFLEEQDEN